jgi:hypothetical protein
MKTRKSGFLAVMAILIIGLPACNTEQTTGTEEEPMQSRSLEYPPSGRRQIHRERSAACRG